MKPSQEKLADPGKPGWGAFSIAGQIGGSPGSITPKHAASKADYIKQYKIGPVGGWYADKESCQTAIDNNFYGGPGQPGFPGSANGGEPAALQSTNPLSALTAGFGALFQGNIWLRAAEVALGLVLIAVGVAKLTHAVPIATKIAGVAAKGALL